MDTIESRGKLLIPDMCIDDISTNIQKFGTGIFTNLGSDQIMEKLEDSL
ncbi:MAG: hypothetical protein IIC67_04225 [Thaumarchaeota archaeon]|nr:hypothetical protein [Nitrososphaerota archaeon]